MFKRLSTLACLVLPVILLLNMPAMAADNQPEQGKSATGTLLGQFLLNDGKTPLANGRLYIYNEAMGASSPDSIMRVPDYMTNLSTEGRFSMELPAGIYYLSASKAPEAGTFGPPAEGEPIYFKVDAKGDSPGFTVVAGSKTDTGVISTSAPMKRNHKSSTMAEGKVIDANGAPIEGAVIFVYLSPNIKDKAFYISEKTGSDGKFTISVNEGGVYYLRVRSEYGGGAPKDGEIINQNPNELTIVTLNKGETLSGLKIQIMRLKRGPLYKGS